MFILVVSPHCCQLTKLEQGLYIQVHLLTSEPLYQNCHMRTLLMFNNNINGAVSGEKYNISGDIFVLVGILPF